MSSSARVIAVIPARAGSKGIPGKNLREVAGRSLVARSIAVARAARTVDAVVVSTDGDAIAAEAVAAGARVVRRPVELAEDEASSESALLHALEALSTGVGTGVGTDVGTPEVLVFLQATSPFTDPVAVDRAVERVLTGSADAVLAAAPSHAFLWRTAADGSAVAVNHDAATRPRRQDREPEYRETGAFYALRVDGFRAARHRFFGRVELAVVPARTAIDIDDVHDLDLAAALAPLVEPVTAHDRTELRSTAPHPDHTEHARTEHDPTDPHPARTAAAENGAP
ncbi:acylneuraminate cytidylyltransferase family protein [Curtobacterium sp. MCJR17_055]|uniref:acylneuraminate cytidylyltransferase family protein n=1 Tax=unclassified Curtobacterium TaxID=257496 RepID=UPI000D83F091|nr:MULTISPECIES: acylneuraminate cytidylyltransferase family protein [unclassified Curtobacterium]PYY34511.1 acylneuraminate cytidylyltransferase family protein [Curtobacterium sp. MCBD17_029]PYY57672.1 acylneuraminate cytidylyltransferase family protein [Curtobacterium sp. MCPF17_015]PYY58331.1 acylneuraminate cytidylyltransferase family protein [Curtobacterium sp. MCJR17_055]